MNWKFWKKKEEIFKFPCSSDHCLVRVACTKPCEKIEMDDNKLIDLFMEYEACPDCGCDSFAEGPAGGASTNVKCNGCGHYFNFALPVFVQRIHCSNERFNEAW